MISYTIRRLMVTLPVLLLITVLTFVAIRIVPGDLAQVRLGDNATPQDARLLREELGLDEPLINQYWDWIRGMAQGDPGVSLQSGLPVASQLRSRLPVTIELALMTTFVSVCLALPLGILSATFRGTLLDHVVRVMSVLGQAIPSFWLAIMALTLLSIYAHWAPPFAYRPLWEDPRHNLEQMLLPVVILGFAQSAPLMRMTRTTMLETLRHDYIRTARAKGLHGRTVIMSHALRNALIPIVTVVGIQTGTLIAGAIVLEQIFSLPGVGKLTLESITSRDYTQLQFNVLVLAAAVLLINLVVDLSYQFLNPRVRVS